MKLLLATLITFTCALPICSQTLSVEFNSEHQSNNVNQYPLKDGLLELSQASYSFGDTGSPVEITTPIAFDLSTESGKVGVVRFKNSLSGEVFDVSGTLLSNTELGFMDANDQTIQMTVLESGEFILRDNVANFSFFDAAGKRGNSLSVASQASGGERPSEIAYSTNGETIVLYNPVIRYNGRRGSRASVVTGNGSSTEIFNSTDQVIDHLSVSDDGRYIQVASSAGNEDSYFRLYDRYGNELLLMETGMVVKGSSLSSNGSYLTLYSDNRVQVYRVADQERIGSSTSRTRIIHAIYSPEDELVISLGGQLNEDNTLESPEVTAIHLGLRQIERESLSGKVSMLKRDQVVIERTSAGRFTIDGINKPINVRASF